MEASALSNCGRDIWWKRLAWCAGISRRRNARSSRHCRTAVESSTLVCAEEGAAENAAKKAARIYRCMRVLSTTGPEPIRQPEPGDGWKARVVDAWVFQLPAVS